jgi:hypothetical protein
MSLHEVLIYMAGLPMVKVVLPATTGSVFMEGKVVNVADDAFELELFPYQLDLATLAPDVDLVLSCDKGGNVYFVQARVAQVLGAKRLRARAFRFDERSQQREFFRVNAEVFLKLWLVEQEDRTQRRVRRQQINLSGNGLRFEVDKPLHVGQLLGLELGLPEVDGEVAQGVGRVVRIADKGEGRQEASLELVELEESEQDKIIRFCLAEQRKQLRMKVRVR